MPQQQDSLEAILEEFNEALGWTLTINVTFTSRDLQLVIDHCCARGRSDLAKRFVKCGRQQNFNVGMPQ